MRTLAVGDQQEPFGGGETDGDPDAGLHVTDYRRKLDSERVFALRWAPCKQTFPPGGPARAPVAGRRGPLGLRLGRSGRDQRLPVRPARRATPPPSDRASPP